MILSTVTGHTAPAVVVLNVKMVTISQALTATDVHPLVLNAQVRPRVLNVSQDNTAPRVG